MELWIRTSDKLCLTKVHHLYVDGCNNIMQENDLILATYKTKERALEVLDEIQNILKPRLIIKDSGKIIGTFEDTIIREGANYELKELPTYVYEMPEE